MIHGPVRKDGAAVNKPAGNRTENARIVGADAMIPHDEVIVLGHAHRPEIAQVLVLRRHIGLRHDLPVLTLAVTWSALTTEDTARTWVSGKVGVVGCFSSGFSIFSCLVFIAWPSRPAPDAFCRRCRRSVKGAVLLHAVRFTDLPCSLLAKVGLFAVRCEASSGPRSAVNYSRSRA